MRCEDFPCCGHELGDCDGSLYGSDEAIKAQVIAEMDREDGREIPPLVFCCRCDTEVYADEAHYNDADEPTCDECYKEIIA